MEYKEVYEDIGSKKSMLRKQKKALSQRERLIKRGLSRRGDSSAGLPVSRREGRGELVKRLRGAKKTSGLVSDSLSNLESRRKKFEEMQGEGYKLRKSDDGYEFYKKTKVRTVKKSRPLTKQEFREQIKPSDVPKWDHDDDSSTPKVSVLPEKQYENVLWDLSKGKSEVVAGGFKFKKGKDNTISYVPGTEVTYRAKTGTKTVNLAGPPQKKLTSDWKKAQDALKPINEKIALLEQGGVNWKEQALYSSLKLQQKKYSNIKKYKLVYPTKTVPTYKDITETVYDPDKLRNIYEKKAVQVKNPNYDTSVNPKAQNALKPINKKIALLEQGGISWHEQALYSAFKLQQKKIQKTQPPKTFPAVISVRNVVTNKETYSLKPQIWENISEENIKKSLSPGNRYLYSMLTQAERDMSRKRLQDVYYDWRTGQRSYSDVEGVQRNLGVLIEREFDTLPYSNKEFYLKNYAQWKSPVSGELIDYDEMKKLGYADLKKRPETKTMYYPDFTKKNLVSKKTWVPSDAGEPYWEPEFDYYKGMVLYGGEEVPIGKVKTYKGGPSFITNLPESQKEVLVTNYLKKNPSETLQSKSQSVKQFDISRALFPEESEDVTLGAGTGYQPVSERTPRETAWNLISKPESELQDFYWKKTSSPAKGTFLVSKGMAQGLTWLPSLVQTGEKAIRGEESVIPDIPATIEKSMYTGKVRQGVVSGTVSEAITLGHSDFFETTKEKPLETTAISVGEIAGMVLSGRVIHGGVRGLRAGVGKAVSKVPARIRTPVRFKIDAFKFGMAKRVNPFVKNLSRKLDFARPYKKYYDSYTPAGTYGSQVIKARGFGTSFPWERISFMPSKGSVAEAGAKFSTAGIGAMPKYRTMNFYNLPDNALSKSKVPYTIRNLSKSEKAAKDIVRISNLKSKGFSEPRFNVLKKYDFIKTGGRTEFYPKPIDQQVKSIVQSGRLRVRYGGFDEPAKKIGRLYDYYSIGGRTEFSPKTTLVDRLLRSNKLTMKYGGFSDDSLRAFRGYNIVQKGDKTFYLPERTQDFTKFLKEPKSRVGSLKSIEEYMPSLREGPKGILKRQVEVSEYGITAERPFSIKRKSSSYNSIKNVIKSQDKSVDDVVGSGSSQVSLSKTVSKPVKKVWTKSESFVRPEYQGVYDVPQQAFVPRSPVVIFGGYGLSRMGVKQQNIVDTSRKQKRVGVNINIPVKTQGFDVKKLVDTKKATGYISGRKTSTDLVQEPVNINSNVVVDTNVQDVANIQNLGQMQSQMQNQLQKQLLQSVSVSQAETSMKDPNEIINQGFKLPTPPVKLPGDSMNFDDVFNPDRKKKRKGGRKRQHPVQLLFKELYGVK